MSDHIQISVYCHISPDFQGEGPKTFFTLAPVAACEHKYVSPVPGFDPSAIDYSHGASFLLGTITAPAGSKAYTDATGIDRIKIPSDFTSLSLPGAVRLAKGKLHRLTWQPAEDHGT